MANSIVPFQFESNSVRVVVNDGDPWFVLSDVLGAMESKTRPTDAKTTLQEELGNDVVTNYPLETAGGIQNVLIINEMSLTFLVSRSRTEIGKRLNRWIHIDILPSIRKTGGYGQRQELSETEKLRIELENAKIKLEIAKFQLETTKVQLETTKTDVERERFALDSKQPSESMSQFSQLPTVSAYNSSHTANAIQKAKLIDAIATYMDKYEREHKRTPDIRILHQRFQRWVLITDDGKPIRMNSSILRGLMSEVNAYRAACQ